MVAAAVAERVVEVAHLPGHVGADVDGRVPARPVEHRQVAVAVGQQVGRAGQLVGLRCGGAGVTSCPASRAAWAMPWPTKRVPPMIRIRMLGE